MLLTAIAEKCPAYAMLFRVMWPQYFVTKDNQN